MTTLLWFAGIVVFGAAGLTVFGFRFHRKQNSGALGGRISRPKAYWLSFATFFWFVLCPAVAWFGRDLLSSTYLWALGGFGVFMWLRGAAEMLMLYVTKNWRPPYGITHDALCIALVLGALAVGHDDVAATIAAPGIDRWALFLCVAVLASLVLEIHHAWSFFVAVHGNTTGEGGVWFADDEDPRFRAINDTTRRGNAVLTACVLAFLLAFGWALVDAARAGAT